MREQLPKAGIKNGSRFKQVVDRWLKEPQVGHAGGAANMKWCRELDVQELEMAKQFVGPCCVYHDEEEPLAPVEESVVTCRWIGPRPKNDFRLELAGKASQQPEINVIPGVCSLESLFGPEVIRARRD